MISRLSSKSQLMVWQPQHWWFSDSIMYKKLSCLLSNLPLIASAKSISYYWLEARSNHSSIQLERRRHFPNCAIKVLPFKVVGSIYTSIHAWIKNSFNLLIMPGFLNQSLIVKMVITMIKPIRSYAWNQIWI